MILRVMRYIMKRLFVAICGIALVLGISGCTKSGEQLEGFNLTATAWADNEATLSVAFLINDGISMTTSKDGYVFVQGTYSVKGNTVNAKFTDRQDGMDSGGIKTLDKPIEVSFKFNLAKDKKSATIPGGLSFLGYNSSISLKRVR